MAQYGGYGRNWMLDLLEQASRTAPQMGQIFRDRETRLLKEARLGELNQQQSDFDRVRQNLLSLPETAEGEPRFTPAQTEALSGPARTESGIPIREMIDSIVLGIPLDKFATSRAEQARSKQLGAETAKTEAQTPGEAATSKIKQLEMIAKAALPELENRVRMGNSTAEDNAALGALYSMLNIDPNRRAPEAGTPMEKATGELARRKGEADIGSVEADIGSKKATAVKTGMETTAMREKLPLEKSKLAGEIGKLGAETAKARAETGEVAAKTLKLGAEIEKVKAETGNLKLEPLKMMLNDMTKMGMNLTQAQARDMAVRASTTMQQGGGTAEVLASATRALYKPGEEQEYLDNLISSKEAVVNQLPKINKDDPPLVQGSKIREAQEVLVGMFYDPVYAMLKQRLGPKATDDQVAAKTIEFINSKVVDQYEPVRNSKGGFTGFKTQYPDTKPFQINKRVGEAGKKLGKPIKSVMAMVEEFLSTTPQYAPYSARVRDE